MPVPRLLPRELPMASAWAAQAKPTLIPYSSTGGKRPVWRIIWAWWEAISVFATAGLVSEASATSQISPTDLLALRLIMRGSGWAVAERIAVGARTPLRGALMTMAKTLV